MNTKIKTIIISLIAAGGFATASGLAVPTVSQAEDTIVELQNSYSSKCLQPMNGSQGASIVQETCNGSLSQQWTRKVEGRSVLWGLFEVDSTEHFVNRSSQFCLDARGGANNGTPIEQWTCNSITNEAWEIGVGQTESQRYLVSRVSNSESRCISTPGTYNGDAMLLSVCNPEASEYFSLGTARLAPPVTTLPVGTKPIEITGSVSS